MNIIHATELYQAYGFQWSSEKSGQTQVHDQSNLKLSPQTDDEITEVKPWK